MTVGELKLFLANSELPDSAEVVIPGRHSLHVCQAAETTIGDINHYGQTSWKPNGGDPALILQDCSTG